MIQYSGNVRKITGISGSTRQNLINAVVDQLEVCGWTVTSGEGTATVVLRSGTTPAGFKMKIKLHSNCNAAMAAFAIMNDAETRTSTADGYGGLLRWGTGYQYFMIASPYQVFISTLGLGAQEHVAWGVPYTPSWVTAVTTNVIWLASPNAIDSSTTIWPCWRTDGSLASIGNHAFIVDDVMMESRNDSNRYSGNLHHFFPMSSDLDRVPLKGWHGGQMTAWDPLISASCTGSRVSEGRLIGQHWDAFITNGDQVAIDTTFRFDSHDYHCMTIPTPGSNVYEPPGQLMLAYSNS